MGGVSAGWPLRLRPPERSPSATTSGFRAISELRMPRNLH